jgi:hypothetical protein
MGFFNNRNRSSPASPQDWPRKQQVIREIYHRAFVAAGLLEP